MRDVLVLHIHGLTAALTITHFKRYLFTLLHILLAGALQHRRMQEDILATIFWRHEAKAAHLVKPLDRAGNVIGRAAFIAAEFAPRRGTIPEITTRGTITKATAATAETAAAAEVTARGTIPEITTRGTIAKTTAAAAKAAAATEITTRGTIPESAARGTIPKAAATIEAATAATEAAAAAEITARGAIPEIAARGTIPKATTAAEFTTRRARFATAFALLQLHDPRNQAPALPVRTHFADQLIAGIWRLNACLCQGRGVKKHILPIWSQYEAEAFTGVVPLHLGLDRPGAILVLVFRKHCLTIHTKMTATRGMQRWYFAA